MIVVVHQTIGMAIPVVTIDRIQQQRQKLLTIMNVATCSHMIQRSAELYEMFNLARGALEG